MLHLNRLWVGAALAVSLSLWGAGCGDVVVPAGGGEAAGQPDAVGGGQACEFGHDDQCDDGDGCTVDSCLSTGVCEHTARTDVCKIDGTCVDAGALSTSSQCQVCDPARAKDGWSPVLCDDENPCTRDLCDPAQGCTAVPDNTLPCDDGQECSTDDRCEDGQCVASPCGCTDAATDCDDGLACTVDTCDPDTGECGHTVAGGACLFNGQCYDAGEACDDANPCTDDDACQEGACVGTPKTCEATTTCRVSVCDTTTGQCVESDAEAGAPCDDGDPCTVGDVCGAGAACAGTPKDCGPPSPCHTISCEGGSCQETPVGGSPCDDGSACTLNDTCTAEGQCVGTWDDQSCGCDDDGPCATLDGPCTTGKCDTAQHTCFAQPKAGACDDANPCTSGDACEDGICVGTPHTCAPPLSCMTSACDGAGGCIEGVMEGFCAIDGACYQDGMANPANPCEVCDAGQSPTAWSHAEDDTPCNADGNGCTDGDACQAGVCVAGPQVSCDDGKGCTTDTCTSAGPDAHTCSHPIDAGSCLIGGVCYASGALSSDKCDTCDPGQDPTAWTPRPAGTVCATPLCQDDSVCNGAGQCIATMGKHDGELCGKGTKGLCDAGSCHWCCEDTNLLGKPGWSGKPLCVKPQTLAPVSHCPRSCCGANTLCWNAFWSTDECAKVSCKESNCPLLKL